MVAMMGQSAWRLGIMQLQRRLAGMQSKEVLLLNFSRQSSTLREVEDLKTGLRELYKLVHPDLFQADVTAKAGNERSFKLLQDYLSLARSSDPRSFAAPAARLPYRFLFHLRQTQGNKQPAEDAASEPSQSSSSATSSSNGFQKVELTLPPPTPEPQPPPPSQGDGTSGTESHSTSSRSSQEDRLPARSRRALGRLLRACGIAVRGLEEEGALEGEEGLSDPRLSVFLPEAMEAQRQALAANKDPQVRVANIRGAFRLKHQVLVSFMNGTSLPPQQQVAALSALAALVDSLDGIDLSGCRIILGDTLGVDRLGNLCLDLGPTAPAPSDDTVSGWRRLLTGVDLDFVRACMATAQAVRQLESQVAAAAGIRSIFPFVPAHSAEPSYRSFLERLAAAAASKGHVGQGEFKDVSVCVLPAYTFAAQQQERGAAAKGSRGHEDGRGSSQSSSRAQPTCSGWVDEKAGVICVGDAASAEEVYRCVQELGPALRVSQRISRSRSQEAEAMVARVRSALGLRRLSWDQRLSHSHLMASCRRLLDVSEALRHTVEGGSLTIGFTNRMAPGDGTRVEIAHDFQL